ncbi:MAG: type II secretion system protein GspC [Steroidobacteraceae bacterium]
MATVAQALRLDGELASRLIALAPRLVLGLLIVLLGIRTALLVAGLASPPIAPSPAPLPPAASRNVVDLPSILRANLFGQSATGAGSGAAPVTSLALVLAGVIADADEQRGYAMLGTGSQDIKFYKVGDLVPGGAKLHGVQVDRVLLDRGGTVEALLLPPRSSLGLGAAPPAAAPPPMASVERVQQLIKENPGILGQVIQRQAVFADGKLRGMRVYPGPNAAAFSRLGLRAGDLVTAINGSRLDDQTRSNEVFGTLANSAEAHITVTRNGAEQDLVLNLAAVANEAEQLAQPAASEGPPPGSPAPGPQPGAESTR